MSTWGSVRALWWEAFQKSALSLGSRTLHPRTLCYSGWRKLGSPMYSPSEVDRVWLWVFLKEDPHIPNILST